MAKLIIGARHFVSLMRELYGYRKLKMNRLLERTLKNDANLVINIGQKDGDVIASLVHAIEIERCAVSPFIDSAIETSINTGIPAIQYSLEEWKRLVEALNETPSTIDVTETYGIHNVHLDLSKWTLELKNVFLKLLAQGSKQHA